MFQINSRREFCFLTLIFQNLSSSLLTLINQDLVQYQPRVPTKTMQNQQSSLCIKMASKGEKNYTQLDLEAMAVDFALMIFRLYLVGAPNDTIIVTDHHPLLSVFNGKRNGSIGTERTKLRHQDIRFSLQHGKGITNPADYLSRHGIPWETLSKNENKNESADQLVDYEHVNDHCEKKNFEDAPP